MANCFLSYGVYFGNKSAQVNLATPNPDTVGVYAATENNKLSLVIINKDTKPLAYDLSNVPFGSYFLRHFGGSSGVAKWQVSACLFSSSQHDLTLLLDDNHSQSQQLHCRSCLYCHLYQTAVKAS